MRFDVRDRVAAELAFDGGEVVAQQIEDFFAVYGRGRAQRNSAFRSLESIAVTQGAELLIRTIVSELQVDPKILLLQQRDDVLQRVAVLAADAHQVALDRGLAFFLESLINLTISLAFSIGMPCCSVIFCLAVPPAAGSIGP